MATHDYVIANGTGAAVRSDLNNALAAIVSNNSSSSEPGTTYAYQWWADTNANVLKIRNSSNDGWVTLRELDGTMLIEDGSASTPGLAFADDTNTGVYSPAADKIGFATSGGERLVMGGSEAVFNDPGNNVDFRVESNSNTHMLFVDAGNDRVGINTTAPSAPLHINAGSTNDALFVNSSDANVSLGLAGSDGSVRLFQISAGLAFRTGGSANAFGSSGDSERMRIDSSGNVGIGTSLPSALLHLSKTTNSGDVGLIIQNTGTSNNTASVYLNKGSGGEADHRIQNDTGGNLTFARGTNESTYTEQMRIDSSGRLLVGATSSAESLSIIQCVRSSESTLSVFTSDVSASGKAKINLGPSNNVTGAQIICVAEEDFSTGANRTARLEFHTRQNGTLAKRFSITPGGTLVAGDSTNGGPQLFVSDPGSANQRGRQVMYAKSGTSGGQEIFQIFTGSTEKLRMRADGNIYNVNNTYSSLSDVKLKENIVDATSQWDDIKGLRVRKYNFKESTGHDTHTQIGLIAQEVETVSPGLVTDLADNDADGNQTDVVTKSVNYSVLYMKAVKALQEAMDRIETLETKVAALEAS